MIRYRSNQKAAAEKCHRPEARALQTGTQVSAGERTLQDEREKRKEKDRTTGAGRIIGKPESTISLSSICAI